MSRYQIGITSDYPGPMAMTLRLDDDLDLQVERLATAQALSKQQLVVRAIKEYLAREARLARTLPNAEQIVRDNARLLDRLGE